jgi:UDP-N-acetylglucosamine transferase subunit ALG13
MAVAVLGALDYFPTPIYIQAGGSIKSFLSVNREDVIIKKTFEFDFFKSLISSSEVIISHAGVGVLRGAYEASKFTGVFVREGHNREHIDEHQREFVNSLQKYNFFMELNNYEDLVKFLTQKKYNQYISHQEYPFGDHAAMVKTLWEKIDELLAQNSRTPK